MNKNLEIRRVQQKDFEGLTMLYEQIYREDIDNSYWDWKYFQNPCGEHIMFAVIDKGKVVGESGAIAARVKCGDESFPASQICDIKVLPGYRNGGAFFQLLKLINEENIRHRNLVSFGFSVPLTQKISTTLMNFRVVSPVWRLVLILNPTPYLVKRIKVPILSKVLGLLGRVLINLRLKRHYLPPRDKIIEITRFDKRFDQFWEERQRDYAIMVVRNSDYLNWRYFEHPKRDYKVFTYQSGDKLKGFIVLTTVTEEVRRGIIMDIMVDPSDKKGIDYLLSAAIDHFLKEKSDSVMLWLPKHIPLASEVRKWNFKQRETHFSLIVGICQQDEKRIESGYVMNPDHWYFTIGDSDYY